MTINNIYRTIPAKFSIFAEDNNGGPGMFHLQSVCSRRQKEFDKLKNNIEFLVAEERCLTFYELDENEKNQLVGLLLGALDDQTEWLVECKDADMIMSSLGRFMTCLSNSDRDYFVSLMQANAIKYWGEHLNSLIVATRAEYERDLAMNHVDGLISERLGMGF
jgi:hypothetical protein